MRTSFWLLGTLMACSQNLEKPQTNQGQINDTAQSSLEQNYAFSVTLNATSTTAGELVPFTWTVVDADGETVDLEDTSTTLSVSDSLESDLYTSSTAIQPTLVGTHNLTFTLQFNGQSLTDEVEITTTAGVLDRLDLRVVDGIIQAGSSTTFEISGEDRYGNTIDTSTASVGTDLQLNGSELSETLAGHYTVTASFEGLTDVEVVEVMPGPASSISLTAPTTDIERYETLPCTVEVNDSYGNTAMEPWSLWVDGPGQTTVTLSNVTFWEEGSYMIYAAVDGTPLTAELGPIQIDSSGPIIDIFYPDRGHSTTTGTEDLSGHVEDSYGALADVAVNQQSITPDGNGDFSAALNYNWGLNLIETSASDIDGNTATDLRTVLHGTFLSQNTPVPDGLVVRLGDNADGLGPIESYGEGLISSTDLGSLLPGNPVYSNQSGCTNNWLFSGCLYRVNLNISNPSIGNTSLDIDPKANGTVDVTFALYNAQLQWNADGELAYVDTSASGTIVAYSIVVNANLTPSVSNGVISMNMNSVSSSIGGFNFNMNGFLGDVLGFFGVNGLIEDQIKDALKDAIQDAVEDEIPALLEDSLQALEVNENFDIMGNTYTLLAEPSSIVADEDGLSIGMSSQFYADNWVMDDPGLGSLFGDYAVPTWDVTTGTGISLSVDALNQLFYEVWGGGGLSMELTTTELGIGSDDLTLLFPGATDLRFTTAPLLAPVIVDQNGSLELQLGDLGLTFHNGDLSNGDVRLDVYMTLTAPLVMSTDGLTLSATVGTAALSTDVVYPEGSSATDTEALLSELAPLLLPILTDALGEIAIPNIQGFNIQNLTLNVVDGNLIMTGVLSN